MTRTWERILNWGLHHGLDDLARAVAGAGSVGFWRLSPTPMDLGWPADTDRLTRSVDELSGVIDRFDATFTAKAFENRWGSKSKVHLSIQQARDIAPTPLVSRRPA